MSKGIAVAVAVLGVSTYLTPVAHGSVPGVATGTITVTGFVTNSTQQDGANTVSSFTVDERFGGTLSGDCIVTFRAVTHPDGTTTYIGVEHFSGTVNGTLGSLDLLDTGKSGSGLVSGRFTILSGTNDLSELRGEGTYAGVLGIGSTYLLEIHFQP
jgi:hypothetical protein